MSEIFDIFSTLSMIEQEGGDLEVRDEMSEPPLSVFNCDVSEP